MAVLGGGAVSYERGTPVPAARIYPRPQTLQRTAEVRGIACVVEAWFALWYHTADYQAICGGARLRMNSWWGPQESVRMSVETTLQGCLAHKKTPTPLGPP